VVATTEDVDSAVHSKQGHRPAAASSQPSIRRAAALLEGTPNRQHTLALLTGASGGLTPPAAVCPRPAPRAYRRWVAEQSRAVDEWPQTLNTGDPPLFTPVRRHPYMLNRLAWTGAASSLSAVSTRQATPWPQVPRCGPLPRNRIATPTSLSQQHAASPQPTSAHLLGRMCSPGGVYILSAAPDPHPQRLDSNPNPTHFFVCRSEARERSLEWADTSPSVASKRFNVPTEFNDSHEDIFPERFAAYQLLRFRQGAGRGRVVRNRHTAPTCQSTS
jgi:hypothetical protein